MTTNWRLKFYLYGRAWFSFLSLSFRVASFVLFRGCCCPCCCIFMSRLCWIALFFISLSRANSRFVRYFADFSLFLSGALLGHLVCARSLSLLLWTSFYEYFVTCISPAFFLSDIIGPAIIVPSFDFNSIHSLLLFSRLCHHVDVNCSLETVKRRANDGKKSQHNINFSTKKKQNKLKPFFFRVV